HRLRFLGWPGIAVRPEWNPGVGIPDRYEIVVRIDSRDTCDENLTAIVHRDAGGVIKRVRRPVVAIGPNWQARTGVLNRQITQHRINASRIPGDKYVAAAVHCDGSRAIFIVRWPVVPIRPERHARVGIPD